MEVRDLMVGDWVIYRGEPSIVYEIDDYYQRINTEPDGYGSIRCIDASKIEPIPLTPEILEKFGFVKSMQVSDTEPYDVDEEGNMHFSYNEVFWGWWQPNNIFCIPANGLGWLNIKYVHQLQHALRLCGIEKEIIL